MFDIPSDFFLCHFILYMQKSEREKEINMPRQFDVSLLH
jgi:hypothetical protein